MRLSGKQLRDYGKTLTESAQTVSIRRGWNFADVLQWRLSDFTDFISCRAWQEADEAEAAKMKWFAEIAASLGKTTANAAEAIVKTIARK